MQFNATYLSYQQGALVLPTWSAAFWFSRKSRKRIGFALPRFTIGLKKLAPLFHPISKTVKTKTNYDALAHVFPRLASAARMYVEF